MELLVLIPALLVFLFLLYKLTGDDHIFIRKNISIEQMFDTGFNTLWVSLLVSRIYFFLFDANFSGNYFIAFFTKWGGFSFAAAIASAILFLYLVGKYKKIPLGRLFDFFTLSLLFALPVGYLSIALLRWQQKMMIPYMLCTLVYLIAAIVFRKFLYPKLLNRSLKEGTMGIYFFLLFPLVSFATTFVNFGKSSFILFTVTNVMYISIFLAGIVLLIKQERNRLRRRNA
jgi:hypothetical protein